MFRVPEGYFDELPNAISDRIAGASRTTPGFFTLPRVVAGVAMMAALVLGVLYYQSEQQNKSQLTYQEFLELHYVSETDEHLIFEAYLESASGDDEYDQYRNYLIENDVEVSQIINEL